MDRHPRNGAGHGPVQRDAEHQRPVGVVVVALCVRCLIGSKREVLDADERKLSVRLPEIEHDLGLERRRSRSRPPVTRPTTAGVGLRLRVATLDWLADRAHAERDLAATKVGAA